MLKILIFKRDKFMVDFLGIVDEPISGKEFDFLDIHKHAGALVKFIVSTETPMTVGVQGEWGSGKTSLLNQIKERLEEEKNIRQIWINSWENSLMVSPEEALIKIINEIIESILESDNKSQKKDKIMKVASSVFKGALKIGASVAAGTKAGEVLDEAFDVGENSIKKLRKTLDELVTEITEANTNKFEKIVIYVDDLDRIEPKDAVKILELLKNIFNIKKCVFVLAIDYQVVVKGLKDKFGEQTEENEWEFRAFFDKIIQLPFMMPMGQYNISNYIINLLKKIKFIDSDSFDESHINLIIMNTIGGNPRALKRLINAVSLIQIFTGDEELIDLEDDDLLSQDDQKFLLFSLLCIQIAYPKIYELLHSEPDFTNWDQDFAYKQTKKKEEEQEVFFSEFENAKKTDDFDEEWELALFRICYINPRIKKRVYEISKLFSFIKDEFLKDKEGEIGQIVAQILTRTSVTSVSSSDNNQEFVLPERKGAYARRYLDGFDSFFYDKDKNQSTETEILNLLKLVYDDFSIHFKECEFKYTGGISIYVNKRLFIKINCEKHRLNIVLVKHVKNGYRLPKINDLKVSHFRTFNPDARTSTHNSHMYRIFLSKTKEYEDNSDKIISLAQESFDMIQNRKNETLNLNLSDDKENYVEGKVINRDKALELMKTYLNADYYIE